LLVELYDVEVSKEELDCSEMCQHLGEAQFLTTVDASYSFACWSRERKVKRVELVGIFKYLEFFLMLVKGRIWSIDANLLNFAWRLLGWMTTVVFDQLDLLEICG